MRCFFPLIILAFSLNSYAQFSQSECEVIFESANSLFESGNYSLAIKKISAYKICASTNQNQKADELLLKIYQTVNQQKLEAILAQEEAEKQKDIAQNATGAAIIAKNQEEKAKEQAITQRKIAEKRLKIMISRKLLKDAISAQQESPPQWHLSLLLSEQALKLSPSVESEEVVRNTLTQLPVLIQEQDFGEYIGTSKLSNTGKYFAISSGDDYTSGGKTWIWSMENIQSSIYQLNEPGPFLFANKNDHLIIGSRNNKAIVVDCKDQSIVAELSHQLSNVEILALSSDDKYLITKNFRTSENGSIEAADHLFVWDIEKKKVINKIQPTNTVGKNYGKVFFFNYGGKELIGSNWMYDRTEIWELENPKKISIPEIDNKLLSHDGKYLMTYNPDRSGFSLTKLEETKPAIETSEKVEGFKFSSSGKYLLLFFERNIQMWDMDIPRMIWEKEEYVSFPNPDDITFSPNDKYFSLYKSNEVRSVYSGETISTNYWSESNDSIQTSMNSRIGYSIGKKLRFSDPSYTSLYSFSGDTLITATRYGNLQFWLIKPSTEISQAEIPNDRIRTTTSSRNKLSWYVGTYNGVFKYDAPKASIDTLVKSKRSVRAISINNDETLLAYGVEFETIQDEPYGVFLINLKTEEVTHIDFEANIHSLSFNEDGTKLLIGTGISQFKSCNCGLWIYDLQTNSKIKIDSSAGSSSNYYASFYNSDSLILFTTGFETRLINTKSNEILYEIEYGHLIDFNLKFNSVLKARKDLLSVYSIDSTTHSIELKSSKQFKGRISSFKLARDSPYALITVSKGRNKGKVILWDYQSNTEINHFEVNGDVVSADFSLYNPQEIVVCYDNKISSYSLSYDELLKSCLERKIRSLSPTEFEIYLGNNFDEILGN